jgi:hypothetical protein
MRKGEIPARGALWPSATYARQVSRLRAAIGANVYLVEVLASETHLAVRQTSTPHVLLDVLEFPRPDPARGLAPHLILLDDGRGINLGRLVRISVGQAFGPAPAQVLYQDRVLQERLLLGRRRLSHEFIARSSRLALGRLLGKTNLAALEGPFVEVAEDEET